MRNNNLTTREYWEQYWSMTVFKPNPKSMIFKDYIERLRGAKHFLEIGGFPGSLAAWAQKYVCSDTTLLDFFIIEDVVRKIERINDVQENSIKCIEADLFSFQTDQRWDIVASSGFVEHFKDVSNVINAHVKLLSSNGRLLIAIPNFLGINGLVQKVFDKKNLSIHNLESMHIDNLKRIIFELGMKEVDIRYNGRPAVWIEPKNRSIVLVYAVKVISKLIGIFPFKGRFWQPYIVVVAQK